MQLGSILWGAVLEGNLLADAHYPVSPTQQVHVQCANPSTIVLVHTYYHCHISTSTTHSFLIHLSHISISYVFAIVTLKTAMCHTVLFYLNSFTHKYLLQ